MSFSLQFGIAFRDLRSGHHVIGATLPHSMMQRRQSTYLQKFSTIDSFFKIEGFLTADLWESPPFLERFGLLSLFRIMK